MFETIITNFYHSLSNSILKRKNDLDLTRDDILKDPTRVTDIISERRDKHHPYMIGRTEYKYLADLYRFDNKDDFLKKGLQNTDREIYANYKYDNYDQLLWGHINWEELFNNTITELSNLDSSNNFGELFENTLIDYVPYALIKYEKLNPKYARIYIPPDERAKERENAIYWVHLRYGSTLFKQIFLDKFKGAKNLNKFDEHFIEFVKVYLEKKIVPREHSLGYQAYDLHNSISTFRAYWESLVEVQYSDLFETSSDLEKLLRDYWENGVEQIRKLKQYQVAFDALNVDIK